MKKLDIRIRFPLGLLTFCLLLVFSSGASQNESESESETENQRNGNIRISLFKGNTPTSWRVSCEGKNVTSLTLHPCEFIEDCDSLRIKTTAEPSKCLTTGNSTDPCNSPTLKMENKMASPCPQTQVQLPKLTPMNPEHKNDSKIKDGDDSANSTVQISSKQEKEKEEEELPKLLQNCFHAELEIPRDFPSGLIECKSVSEGEEKEILDYFYTLPSTQRKIVLVSNSNSSEPRELELENLQLDVYYTRPSQQMVILPPKVMREIPLYSNQQVVVDCKVPKFMYKKSENSSAPILEIRVIKTDESFLNYDSKLMEIVAEEDSANWHVRISNFRVYNEILGFSCRAKSPLNSSEWIEKSVNFTVVDPPSVFTARSKTGEIFNVTKAMRCGLTGSPHKNKTLMSKYFSLLQLFEYKLKLEVPSQEFKIKDAFQYLRFQEIAGDDYYCYNDEPRTQHQHTKEKTPSGFFPEHPVDFKLTAPIIDKPEGAIVKIDNGKGKNRTVNNQLFCKFNGSPEPYIFWLKNGLELLYSLSENRNRKNENSGTFQDFVTFELPLNNQENNKTTTSKKMIDNYSCIARNFLGQDRLDFLVTS